MLLSILTTLQFEYFRIEMAKGAGKGYGRFSSVTWATCKECGGWRYHEKITEEDSRGKCGQVLAKHDLEYARIVRKAAAEKGEAGREELEAAIRTKYFDKPINITVRAKMDNYNGDPCKESAP